MNPVGTVDQHDPCGEYVSGATNRERKCRGALPGRQVAQGAGRVDFDGRQLSRSADRCCAAVENLHGRRRAHEPCVAVLSRGPLVALAWRLEGADACTRPHIRSQISSMTK